jgi:hypothetical protein
MGFPESVPGDSCRGDRAPFGGLPIVWQGDCAGRARRSALRKSNRLISGFGFLVSFMVGFPM